MIFNNRLVITLRKPEKLIWYFTEGHATQATAMEMHQ